MFSDSVRGFKHTQATQEDSMKSNVAVTALVIVFAATLLVNVAATAQAGSATRSLARATWRYIAIPLNDQRSLCQEDECYQFVMVYER